MRKVKQTPLEQHSIEAQVIVNGGKGGAGNGTALSKEIIDFDKKFFQKQLEKLAKTYSVELKT
jgi:hypothetical protein